MLLRVWSLDVDSFDFAVRRGSAPWTSLSSWTRARLSGACPHYASHPHLSPLHLLISSSVYPLCTVACSSTSVTALSTRSSHPYIPLVPFLSIVLFHLGSSLLAPSHRSRDPRSARPLWSWPLSRTPNSSTASMASPFRPSRPPALLRSPASHPRHPSRGLYHGYTHATTLTPSNSSSHSHMLPL